MLQKRKSIDLISGSSVNVTCKPSKMDFASARVLIVRSALLLKEENFHRKKNFES